MHRRVERPPGEELVLDLAQVEVEDGRALEGVARVEVEHPVGLRALALEQRGQAGGAAERARLGDEPEVDVGLQRVEVVGQQARVDVRGVQQGEVHLLAGEVEVDAPEHGEAGEVYRGRGQKCDEREPASRRGGGGSGERRMRIEIVARPKAPHRTQGSRLW